MVDIHTHLFCRCGSCLFALLGGPNMSPVDNSTTAGVLEEDPCSTVGVFDVYFSVALTAAAVLLTIFSFSCFIVCSQFLFLKYMKYPNVEISHVPLAQTVV